MSLSYVLLRSINRFGSTLRPCQNFYTASLSSIYVTPKKLISSEVCETHDEKNIRLKRPMSPHLTIYHFDRTILLSIYHRITGGVLSVYTISLGIVGLFGGVNGLVTAIDGMCLAPAFLFLGKLIISFPASYHFFNGVRHLMWDLGNFLNMKQVVKTGNIMLFAATITALILAAL